MNRYEKAAAAAVALMLAAAGAIFFYAPTDALQGPVQRIFYLHVSSAIAADGCLAVRAVVGIFGFIDVPVVHFSVTWWRTQHPGPIVVNNALPAEMLAAFFFTLVCTLVLATALIAVRYRIETLLDAKLEIAEPAKLVTAQHPEAVP